MTELPKDKAFSFFTSIGNSTGEYACSLEEFLEKVEKIFPVQMEF